MRQRRRANADATADQEIERYAALDPLEPFGAVAAGWYLDPADPSNKRRYHRLRYWDGEHWSDRVRLYNQEYTLPFRKIPTAIIHKHQIDAPRVTGWEDICLRLDRLVAQGGTGPLTLTDAQLCPFLSNERLGRTGMDILIENNVFEERDLDITGVDVGNGITVVHVTARYRATSAPTPQAPSPAPLTPPANTKPGWYPDPLGRSKYRRWDGQTWTEEIWRDGDNAIAIDPPV